MTPPPSLTLKLRKSLITNRAIHALAVAPTHRVMNMSWCSQILMALPLIMPPLKFRPSRQNVKRAMQLAMRPLVMRVMLITSPIQQMPLSWQI